MSTHNSTRPRSNPTPSTKSKFIKILNINCNSLKGTDKRADFAGIVDRENPDIILGTESKLDKNYSDTEVFPEGFKVIRKDRSSHGGGVFIAHKSELSVTEIKKTDDNCELVMGNVKLAGGEVLLICSYYRPPDCNPTPIKTLAKNLESSIFNRTDHTPRVVLGGDFNAPDIDWGVPTIKPSPQYGLEVNEGVLNLCEEFPLIQTVMENTRNDNILDLIFTTDPDLVDHVSTTPGISDHAAVTCTYSHRPVLNTKPPRKVLSFKKADWDSLQQDLTTETQSFLTGAQSLTTEENWCGFKDLINRCVAKHIPERLIKPNSSPPWITRDIRKLARRKKRARLTAVKSKKSRDWDRYEELYKETRTTIREAHQQYLSSLFTPEEGQTHLKRFWGYIRSMKRDSSGIPTLRKDESLVSDSKEKAEILAHQYESVFTEEDLTHIPDKGTSPFSDMSNITITVAGVAKLLSKLNPKKAVGPDGIPTRILRENADVLAPALTHIFQQSLATGEVPKDWRSANVAAIFKKGDKHQASNYRPVSLTSLSCKLLEHIVFKNVMDHCDAHSILAHFQHGFRQRHSCVSQLIITTEDLCRSLDRGKQQDLLILDFSKAFDTVPHQRLLYKLSHYGINGTTLTWIRNWLIDRSQRVVVDGEASGEAHVRSGVPQGTVLGPLLFILYVNDIAEGVSSNIKLFADDCLVYRDINNISDTQKLQQDLDRLVEWSSTWQMQFNAKKCHTLRITKKRCPVKHDYIMLGHRLEVVEHHPYLGLEFSNELSWNHHLDQTKAKATRSLNLLRRNVRKCPQSTRETAYTTLVRPHLEYGSPVWDPYHNKQIAELEQVQRRAARYVCQDYRRESSVTHMLEQLKWETLQQRRFVARMTIMYQAVHQLVAIPIPTYYIPSPRGDHQYIPIHVRTDIYKFSFFPRTIRWWNHLPVAILEAPSVNCFKSRLQTALTDGQITIQRPKDSCHSPYVGPEARSTFMY